jgi:hypothetical protein
LRWRELEMIRVCIEVECGGSGTTTLAVKAENILRALEIAGEQNPGCVLSVVFPLARDGSERVEAGTAGVAA